VKGELKTWGRRIEEVGGTRRLKKRGRPILGGWKKTPGQSEGILTSLKGVRK